MTHEEQEENAIKTEEILRKRVSAMREAQAKYEFWDGFRLDNGFAEDVQKAEQKLKKHIEENLEYLI